MSETLNNLSFTGSYTYIHQVEYLSAGLVQEGGEGLGDVLLQEETQTTPLLTPLTPKNVVLTKSPSQCCGSKYCTLNLDLDP